jgi:hypothetical protein
VDASCNAAGEDCVGVGVVLIEDLVLNHQLLLRIRATEIALLAVSD